MNQKTTPSVGKKNGLTSGNDNSSFSNSFEALNVENSVNEEVETCNKASTSGVQEEGQNSTPLVEKNNMFEKPLLEGECVLVDDDGVGYATKSLLEKWSKTYVNGDYDLYDDDMYEEVITKKYGGKSGASQPVTSQDEQIVSDNGKGTTLIKSGNTNDTEKGNFETCSTTISTTAPNTTSFLINVSISPTIDLNNIGPIVLGPTSYAKLVSGEASRKSLNFHILITHARNGADVVIPLDSIRDISERFANTAYGFFWGKRVAYTIVANYADVELKDTILVDMLKLIGEGFYMCIIHVEYEWKPPRCSSCKVFCLVLDECPKNIGSDVAKNLKNPRQAARCVPAALMAKRSKMWFLEERNPISKVVFMENVDSDSEVEDVVNEHAGFIASTSLKHGNDSGYGTNSLLEQWRKTKRDNDYDPYDDDLYKSHDMSKNLQAVCDDFDITVVATSEPSFFVGCGSEGRRGIVEMVVSAMVSNTSGGGVPVKNVFQS
ncbi:hypothetical protein Tco_0236051 [Tanacetum coccineum]